MSSELPTPFRLGRYHLRFLIARGGMGGVYLARASGAGGVDKVVAIKLLHEHMAGNEAVVKMFLDEARIASLLNHANACATFDFGEHEGVHFLVMEYLEGEPLNRVLKALAAGIDRHPLHPWLIARLLADAAEGLHAAHQLTGSDGLPLDVVHRDVSPHNIFVTYDGVTKVVDFGIARARERSSSTEVGVFKGKLEYASPEQLSDEPVDRRTDVWALGVCLWELLAGKRLFHRTDYAATAHAVLVDPIPAPSSVVAGLPRVFDTIVGRALQREPSQRFQSARDFGRALRDALANSGTAIDGRTIEEWLETLFPGDRNKRQALSATVRQSSPDAPLEEVPASLKVTDLVTGSKRNFPRARRPAAAPSPEAPTIDSLQPVAAVSRSRARPTPSKRRPWLVALGLLGALGLGGAFSFFVPSLWMAEAPSIHSQPEPEPEPELAHQPEPAPQAEPARQPEPPEITAEASPVVDAGLREPEEPRAPPPVAVSQVAKPVIGKKEPRPREPAVPPVMAKTSAAVGGWVHFKTPGGSAEVHVDGNKAGTTPLSLNLPGGRHTVELKAVGVEFGGPQTITVTNGSDFKVEVDLR